MFNPLDPANRSKVATLSKVALALFWLTLIVVTHIPPSINFEAPEGGDKLAHFTAYATLAFLLATTWQLNAGVLTGRHLFLVWLAAALFGVADEITQLAVGRDCTIGDWSADAFGAATGVLAFVLLRWMLERRANTNE
jgi:VanZ family protein